MTARPLRATYRIQFEASFGFAEAEALVPYWAELGVSHVYASPIFQARPGSRHGYDIVDHGAINPELGGEAGFRRFARALAEAGLGLILDIVPNHAGIGGPHNPRWLDVLEFGPRAASARFFDIDWRRGPLTLPILDGEVDTLVADGTIRAGVDPDEARLVLRVYDHVLPLRPETVAELLADIRAPGFAAAERWAELDTRPPDGATATGDEIAERRAALGAVLADPAVAAALEARLADPVRLAAVLAEQHWQLLHWRRAARSLGYRRFFDITDLAGLRVEDPAVFEAVHALPVALVRDGAADGLRVDHVDGLADPAGYAQALRGAVGADATIHVEKILGPDEPLRPWPIDGTTGYETLNAINGLFVDPDGYARLARHLGDLGVAGTPEERLKAAKCEILETSLAAELRVLAAMATALLRRRSGLPVARTTVRRALAAWIAALPVYRTYIAGAVSPEDERLVRDAAAAAREDLGRLGRRVLDGLVEVMLAAGDDPAAARFVVRLQQLSGPAMAKGYEDTELYRFPALLSVNEVGSHLDRPSLTIEAFLERIERTGRDWPLNLIPLATHDTKRGADTRARLNLLSEMTEEWIRLTRLWHDRHRRLRRTVDGAPAPDAIDEAIVYQTLFGAWPVSRERIEEYLTKALREAKRHTAWTRQNPGYEAAALGFAAGLLEGEGGRTFRAEMDDLATRLAVPARRHGLAQTALQLTLPGVPDLYRGTEFWDHSLVDPDNRRPVDWDERRAGLRLKAPPPLDKDRQGFAKQRLTAALLGLRRTEPALFGGGTIQRLASLGATDILAFARKAGDRALVVAVATRALVPDEAVLVALPFHRWSLRAIPWGGPADVVDNALRLERGHLPFVAVLDVLAD